MKVGCLWHERGHQTWFYSRRLVLCRTIIIIKIPIVADIRETIRVCRLRKLIWGHIAEVNIYCQPFFVEGPQQQHTIVKSSTINLKYHLVLTSIINGQQKNSMFGLMNLMIFDNIIFIGKNFGGKDFWWYRLSFEFQPTRNFGGQNFRLRTRFSTLLSSKVIYEMRKNDPMMGALLQTLDPLCSEGRC